MKKQVLGIFVSDIHFSEVAPVARSCEPDWLLAQKRYVDQLRSFQKKHNAPIFIAGDVFDKWNSSAHLINHILAWIAGLDIYAIPGNHDCPHHNYKQLGRSSYWTLVEANAIRHLSPTGTTTVGNLVVHPFPFGFSVTPPNLGSGGLCFNVALVHDYMWAKGCGHEKASEESSLKFYRNKLKGYDATFAGDNHITWLANTPGKSPVANCGAMIPRSISEREMTPRAYLLYDDGSVGYEEFDTALDVWTEAEGASDLEQSLKIDLRAFTEELERLQGEGLDFPSLVRQWVVENVTNESVARILLACLGGKK